MNRFYRSLLLTGIVAAGLAGCGDDVTVVDPPPPPPPPTPQVRAVTVTPDNVSVSPGQTVQMQANVTADAGATPTITWSTSDATRATVSNTGLVTVLANAPSGPVAIRATATANGSTASGAATLNVVGTTVTGVVVTPATATLTTSQTLQASATVNGTNNPAQTVTWTSLSPTIASVSGTGLVTANATTAGNAVIRACSTVNPNICGTLAVEVVVPSPATVSIQSVTRSTGTSVVPVVLTNVFGQIEITLNVDNGSKTLTRVDALIGGTVVASQSFANVAPVEAAPSAAPQIITLSVNTAQLRQNGGIFVPVVFNGNSAITANLFVVGSSTPIASNAIPVVMNNGDALVQTSSRALVPTSASPSVVVGSNTWYKGTQTVSGFHYVAFGKAVPATVTLGSSLCGASGNLVPTGATATAGIALTGTYACGSVEGGNTVAAPVTTAYAAGAVGPDGTPLTAPAGYASVGTAFVVNGENRWNMIMPAVGALPGPTFVDNLAPTVTVQAGAVGVGPAVAFNDAADQQWVNASYAFAQDIGATDGGTGVATGFPSARVYNPGSFTPASAGCSSTVVTTGANFTETVTSTATDGKRICAYAEDLLGNAASSGPSNYFGVDFGAPAIRFLGATAATPAPTLAASTVSATANTTIYSMTALPPNHAFGVEGLDTRSGFDQGASILTNFPATLSLTRFNASGTVACNMGAGGLAFADPFGLPTILSDTYVRSNEVPILCAGGGLGGVGYYAWTGNVTDRAGNAATAISRNFAADHLAAPNITGIGFASALYTPGAAAPFGFSANDDLEIIDATVAVTQTIPSGGSSVIRYPLGSLSPLGTRWDATITNVINGATASIDYFLFRIDETCSAAATPYAGCPAPGAPAAYVTAPKTAVSANYTANAAALPTNVSATVADVASQLAAPAISAPFLTTQFSPSTGIAEPWTAADLISWGAVLTGGNVIATHVASTSIVIPFFDRVSLWRLDQVNNEWVRCGLYGAPVLTDNGAHRFWTYTITAPTTGVCTGANFAPGNNYRVLGAKAGAGLFTPTVP
jgi:hypothetical protein